MNKERDIEFVDEKEQLLFATAQLGEQVRSFLKSPTGRYLHGRAKAEYEAALAEALDCNPDSFFGRRRLRKIQARAEFARHFMKWCVDAITEGDHAFQQVEQYRSED